MKPDKTTLQQLLPGRNNLLAGSQLRPNSHIILACGFEERALGFLKNLTPIQAEGVDSITLIKYLPVRDDNDQNYDAIVEEFNRLGLSLNSLKVIEFNREYLSDFYEYLNSRNPFEGSNYYYLDISAMSKLLILYLLDDLWHNRRKPFSIIYTEACEYGPSREEFEDAFAKGETAQSLSLEFTSAGVFDPIVPEPFQGASPLGSPRALVSFLSFNKRQVIGAAAIVPYQFFVPIISVPSDSLNGWRVDAVTRVNNEGLLVREKLISEIPILEIDNAELNAPYSEYRVLDEADNYIGTLKTLMVLERIHRYRHFITIAPFGTKLQTLAVFLFTLIFPETQIVYASPLDFHPRYSTGVKSVSEIVFEDLMQLEDELRIAASPDLKYLRELSIEE